MKAPDNSPLAIGHIAGKGPFPPFRPQRMVDGLSPQMVPQLQGIPTMVLLCQPGNGKQRAYGLFPLHGNGTWTGTRNRTGTI